MHESLIAYITSHSTTPLSEGDIELIEESFVPKTLRKRQYFLQEGQVCSYSGFIVKGAMRQYSVDDKGTEHIIGLSIENWWAVDRESYTMLTPSKYNIDAWEESDLLVVTKADFFSRLSSIPAFGELMRKLDDHHASALLRRLNSSISYSAEKRYWELANTYPEFLQRFPQHIIASYLGITKETLSRIRHHAIKG